MPNGTYGGVRGKETKVGQKNFRFPTYSIMTVIVFRRLSPMWEGRRSAACF